MIRCANCGAVFAPEDAGVHIENHTVDGRCYPERWMICPECNSDEIASIGQCPICGEYSNGSCGECRKEIKDQLDQIMDMAPTTEGKEAVLDEIQNYVEEYEL